MLTNAINMKTPITIVNIHCLAVSLGEMAAMIKKPIKQNEEVIAFSMRTRQ
jgi:hypothetical protein